MLLFQETNGCIRHLMLSFSIVLKGEILDVNVSFTPCVSEVYFAVVLLVILSLLADDLLLLEQIIHDCFITPPYCELIARVCRLLQVLYQSGVVAHWVFVKRKNDFIWLSKVMCMFQFLFPSH